MTDAEIETPKTAHARAMEAYTSRLLSQGFVQIKLWVPEELRERFYKDAAKARTRKKKELAHV